MAKLTLVIRLLGNRSGGAERLYCELANKLSEIGHDVTCLVYESGAHKPFYPLSPKVSLINLFVPGQSRSRISKAAKSLSSSNKKSFFRSPFNFLESEHDFILQLRRYFKGSKPDAVISFLPPANTPTLIACWGLPIRTICTNHNVPYQDYDNPERWSPNPLDRYLRRTLIRRADRIHVLFDEFGNWFGEGIRYKLRTIQNYIPDDFFTNIPVNDDKENLIVGVGRLAPVKNYSVLIEAWAKVAKKHPGWKIEIYGVGPLKKKLQAEINEFGLSSVIFLKGHEANVKAIYDRAKIFCHPAKYEGFGLSVAESLARSVPVVAFQDCEGVNQYVFNELNGLMLERSSPDSEVGNLAMGLERLILDTTLRESLSKNASGSVREFNESSYYQKWENLISEFK